MQLSSAFGFADVAALADYLADLGVSHAYLSPVLQAVPGSTHGYDVVDHARLSDELGGATGSPPCVSTLRQHGLGVIVDVVPNHMAIPTERLNGRLWTVLRDGRESPGAAWFDIDWNAQEQRILMPVLGSSIGDTVDAGELLVDGSTLRYYNHEFPWPRAQATWRGRRRCKRSTTGSPTGGSVSRSSTTAASSTLRP